MVKRPIHLQLSMESVDQEKLLASCQNMQIAYMESVMAENQLSGDDLCHVIQAMKERINAGKKAVSEGVSQCRKKR